MKQRLTDAPREMRERIALVAREQGAMSALNACIRQQIMPDADDIARWCGHLSAGCTIDSLTAASERMAIAKWQAMSAKGWHLEEQGPDEAQLEAQRAKERQAQLEAWIATRAAELERQDREARRASFEARAREEAKAFGRRTIDAADLKTT